MGCHNDLINQQTISSTAQSGDNINYSASWFMCCTLKPHCHYWSGIIKLNALLLTQLAGSLSLMDGGFRCAKTKSSLYSHWIKWLPWIWKGVRFNITVCSSHWPHFIRSQAATPSTHNHARPLPAQHKMIESLINWWLGEPNHSTLHLYFSHLVCWKALLVLITP